MMRSKFGKVFWAFLLSAMLSNIPQVAFAETAEKMISTAEVVDSMSRSQAEERVRRHLDREDLRNEFLKLGVSPDEVSSRVASLSATELNRLADQMDQARYGGDVVGLLVVALLVLLIIYFAKRI